MPTKNTLIFIAVLFVISFSTTFFIIRSNDHKECDKIINRELDKNGIETAKEEHVCKEKYSF
ncbi:hypothetical protein [Flavobacterium xueshanense]|jgi:hypothetical protein|uniref:Transmembrane protein n=1 Tax=Flavobacterium xueshanense TaxID=935223 RepID=A0A1I2H0R3_9FLAO|nr:hypothetical protein [Flavobacterium xueshanense]SFF23864.1 hypothetical protein SAMN04488131_11253 [Flavobacterium xueshanense]